MAGRQAIGGSVAGLSMLGLLVWPGASVLERLRWLDSGICAQLAMHTLTIGGELLPLCARNTGIYLGYLIMLNGIFMTGRGRAQRIPPYVPMIILACGVLLCGIDGTNSFLLDLGLPHLYQPQNVLRLVSGLLTGLAMAAFLLPQHNRLCWNEYNEQVSLPSWAALGWPLLTCFCCTLAIISQSRLFLYPIALLSTTGLVMAISNVNVIIIVAISGCDQTFTSYRELWPFYGLAILCALGELALLAEGKHFLMLALGISL